MRHVLIAAGVAKVRIRSSSRLQRSPCMSVSTRVGFISVDMLKPDVIWGQSVQPNDSCSSCYCREASCNKRALKGVKRPISLVHKEKMDNVIVPYDGLELCRSFPSRRLIRIRSCYGTLYVARMPSRGPKEGQPQSSFKLAQTGI